MNKENDIRKIKKEQSSKKNKENSPTSFEILSKKNKIQKRRVKENKEIKK